MTRFPKTLMAAGGVLMACGAVALGTLLGAQSPERLPEAAQAPSSRCSNRTIAGDYGFSIDGTIAAGTPNAFLLRGVAMARFDGYGSFSQVDFTTRNGVPFAPDWRPATGTYEINPDCTGSAQIVPSDGTPAVSLRLVVVNHGREIRTIVVGNASGSVGIKVD